MKRDTDQLTLGQLLLLGLAGGILGALVMAGLLSFVIYYLS